MAVALLVALGCPGIAVRSGGVIDHTVPTFDAAFSKHADANAKQVDAYHYAKRPVLADDKQTALLSITDPAELQKGRLTTSETVRAHEAPPHEPAHALHARRPNPHTRRGGALAAPIPQRVTPCVLTLHTFDHLCRRCSIN